MSTILEEIEAAVDELMDRWGPDWKSNPAHRLALDTLHDAAVALRAYEKASAPPCPVSTLNLMVNAARGVVPPREKPVSSNRGPSLNVAGVIVAESAK